VVVVLHPPVRGNGDGGIYTTAADMIMFWRALFAGKIVGKDWLAEMTPPHSLVQPRRRATGWVLAA
jgi:CubicO group peptidase (beta-lactamase class C family)